MRQPSNHHARHREIDESLTRGGQSPVVLAQAAVVAQPSQDALEDPALKQHMKAARDSIRGASAKLLWFQRSLSVSKIRSIRLRLVPIPFAC